jgi:hypothetical protein
MTVSVLFGLYSLFAFGKFVEVRNNALSTKGATLGWAVTGAGAFWGVVLYNAGEFIWRHI